MWGLICTGEVREGVQILLPNSYFPQIRLKAKVKSKGKVKSDLFRTLQKLVTPVHAGNSYKKEGMKLVTSY
jgi:hypothetical protein